MKPPQPSKESLEEAERLMVILGAKIKYGETRVGEIYEFLALALDQARAEQKERDAGIVENEKFVKAFDKTQALHNIICKDIAHAIRTQSGEVV